MLSQRVRRMVLPLTAPIGSVRTVRSQRPLVVLTYDDGPEPGGTERVLEALAAGGKTATFFVLVRRAVRYRTLLEEVLSAGHEVALHGIDHVRLTTMPAREVLRRTRDGRRQLEDLTGREVRWFRPPYGAQLPSTWAAIRAAGLESVVWSHATFDWQDDPVRQVASRALAGAYRGSVLLLHDGHAGQEDGVDDGPAPRFDRHELSRLLLEGLAERGLDGVSLSDAVSGGKVVRGAWFRH